VLGAPGTNGDVGLQVGARCEGSRVRVSDVTDSRVAVCVVGRAASEVLTRAGARELPAGAVRSESIGGIPTIVLRSSELHWLLVAPAEDASELWLALSEAGAPLGLAYVGMDALQHLLAARA
jgi:glycine cleavage system aminomethyltransferase T